MTGQGRLARGAPIICGFLRVQAALWVCRTNLFALASRYCMNAATLEFIEASKLPAELKPLLKN